MPKIAQLPLRFVDRRRHSKLKDAKTHFRSRLTEGRKEESCEWSLAMALSALRVPILPWLQGYDSPQLDFVAGLTQHDPAFEQVVCKFYCDRFIYSLRSLADQRLRDTLLSIFSSIPGKGDFMQVTPFVLHFGWLRYKHVFTNFAAAVWEDLIARKPDGVSEARTAGIDQHSLRSLNRAGGTGGLRKDRHHPELLPANV